jgi:hypothetical protein
MKARRVAGLAFALAGLLCGSGIVRAQTVVPYASRFTVDSDGDGQADLLDNAPGTSNPSQIDTDADGIGDAIDPTPSGSNPALGDPGLGVGGPYNVPIGTHAFIDYLMALQTPPGGFGHIDLDFGGDNTVDAVYFGPLTASTNQIDVAPSVYSALDWNLNALGTYPVYMKACGPGRTSQNASITNVTVVAPEPTAALALLAGVPAVLARRRRVGS